MLADASSRVTPDAREETSDAPTETETLSAALGLLLLCLWALWRLGGFDLLATIDVAGTDVRIAETFARVDHPFHATRAVALLDSLQRGEPLRWIANHQGGYPVEFYPLGIAWLDVGLWALLLGSVPIIAVHKLAVILIFLLPALAFWIMARGDRLNPWTAFLATAIHIAIPGDWTNGGYRELVDWGLVTNVGGATLALIAAAAMGRAIHNHDRRMAAIAALSIAAAAYTNPRSLLAISVATAALLVTALFLPGVRMGSSRRGPILHVAAIAVASMLIAAPVLIPLIRYRDLYQFVHYEGYATLRTYWESTITAVSLPVIILTVAGLLLSFTVQRHAIARSFAIALAGYVALTAGLSDPAASGGLIEQLETPRLMPFQRLVMIYLAAYAIVWIVETGLRLARVERSRAIASIAPGLAGVAILATMLGSVWTFPDIFTTPSIETTRRPEFAEFQAAIQTADEIVPPGTAILVIGNQLDSERWWHQQLWGPLESDAPFFYDDWLWYWHLDHAGPYSAQNGHAYPDPQRAITDSYFQAHGIGAVVVTDMAVRLGTNPRAAAASEPSLRLVRTTGEWDVYAVVIPTPIVTNEANLPTALTIENHEIQATFPNSEGPVTIRRNWFPRWRATADGTNVPIARTADGYMRVTVPPGTRSLRLIYDVTAADWAGRIGVVAGLAVVMGMAVGVGPRGWGRRIVAPDQVRSAISTGGRSPLSTKRSPVAETVQRDRPRPR